MKNIIVADVMTRELHTVSPDANLLECAKKMVRKRIGGLPIVEKRKLKGFISNQDVLWALIKKSKSDLSKVKAIDISPKKVITISPSAKVIDSIKKMREVKFYRLPVVQEGEIIGMITLKDVLSFYPEAYSELSELEFIKEEAEKLKRLENDNKNRIIIEDGICEECGNRDSLYRSNGSLACLSCIGSG